MFHRAPVDTTSTSISLTPTSVNDIHGYVPPISIHRLKIRSGGAKVRKPWQRGEETKVERQKRQRKRRRKKTKALVFSPETPQTQLKKTRFQDDTEAPKEHQLVVRKEKDESASSSNRQRAPAMKLTTERLEQMTVNSPVREDGTKTPLKIPPQPQRTRHTSSVLSSGTEDSELEKTAKEEEEEKKDPAKMTLDEMKAELTRLRRRHREDQDNTEKRIHEIDQSLKETTYDVESHARINAHLLFKQLQQDVRLFTF